MSAPVLSGRARLVRSLFGLYPAQVMHAIVDLGVPERLLAAGCPVAELATDLGAHEHSLERLMRAGIALGLVCRDADGVLGLTEDGTLLAPAVAGSIRNLVLLWGGEGGWRSWGELAHSVRTGRTAYDDVMGESLFERHTTHRGEQDVFDQAMSESSRAAAPGIVAVAPLAGRTRVVDVGGGRGELLSAMLLAHPELTGVLADRPTAMAVAAKNLGNAGVLDRAELAGIDFFVEVPTGGDAYVIKSVLHDWDDDDCVAILARVRAVCAPDTMVLVVEPVIPASDDRLAEDTMMLISDLNMMVCTGGMERTEAEFGALLRRAGFELEETLRCPAPNNLSVLRARPV